jgi:hypothetical protein
MLNALANATTGFVRKHPDLPVSNTTETLSAVVQVKQMKSGIISIPIPFKIFRHNLENKEFYERLSGDDRDLILRVMVGAVILFDHIDAGGAFCRHAPIDVRGVVEVIKRNGSEQQASGIRGVVGANCLLSFSSGGSADECTSVHNKTPERFGDAKVLKGAVQLTQ